MSCIFRHRKAEAPIIYTDLQLTEDERQLKYVLGTGNLVQQTDVVSSVLHEGDELGVDSRFRFPRLNLFMFLDHLVALKEDPVFVYNFCDRLLHNQYPFPILFDLQSTVKLRVDERFRVFNKNYQIEVRWSRFLSSHIRIAR